MKTIVKLFILCTVFLLTSCGDSRNFSTENSIIYEDYVNNSEFKTINYYLNLNEIPELRSKRNVDYFKLDYQGYNLLFDEDFSSQYFNKEEVYLYRGKISLNHKLFEMEDIYSNINKDVGTIGHNHKILKPLFRVSSELILSENFRKKIFKENPRFREKVFLIKFVSKNGDDIYQFHLYFLKNTLLKIHIIMV